MQQGAESIARNLDGDCLEMRRQSYASRLGARKEHCIAGAEREFAPQMLGISGGFGPLKEETVVAVRKQMPRPSSALRRAGAPEEERPAWQPPRCAMDIKAVIRKGLHFLPEHLPAYDLAKDGDAVGFGKVFGRKMVAGGR